MKNEGDKTMKKVLLTSAAALAVFTVAPVFANGETPASTNQLLQKKYVSERDIAEEANRQAAIHDSDIRAEVGELIKEQVKKSVAPAEKALQDFLNSGYSGSDFSDKKAALEANIVAAKEKLNKTFADLYITVKSQHIQKLQKEYRNSAKAAGKYYNDVNGVEDNKPNNTRINDDQANQGTQATQAKAEWIKSGSRWWYKHADGSYTTNGWEKINGTWYYFDQDGWMVTGWVKDNGTWYYLKSSGAMATGWYQVGGKWYYSYASGALAVNTTTPDGYKVNHNGEWV